MHALIAIAQTDRQTDAQTNVQTDRQTDRQTRVCVCMNSCNSAATERAGAYSEYRLYFVFQECVNIEGGKCATIKLVGI